jgi:hypothetical protein
MKFLKYILFAIMGLITTFFVAAFIFPKKYEVVVTGNVNAPRQKVFDYLKMYGNQKEFSEWMKADTNATLTITGEDGTVGAECHWKGDDNVGEGKMINKSVSIDKIEQDLIFIKPMASTAKFNTLFKEMDSTKTEITMSMYGESPIPFNVMSHIFGVPMIRETNLRELQNIKSILEK